MNCEISKSLVILFIFYLSNIVYARKKSKRHQFVSNEVIPKWDDTQTNTQNADKQGNEPDDMKRLFEIIQNMSLDIINLRTTIANIKYQNHMIYKQLKKSSPKCPVNAGLQMTEPATTCPYGFIWSKELSLCVQFNRDRITWRIAREKCQTQDSDLIMISNEKTMSYIEEIARKNKNLRHCDFWIGANDEKSENDWRWVSNADPISYTNWNLNEPNNGAGDEHCAMMLWVFNWKWNDARCKHDNACYICEYKSRLH